MSGQIKGIPLAPLTGVLDLKSSADEIPAGGLRMRQNLSCVGQGKLRRGPGWDKLLNRVSNYNNEDLHDQLLTFVDGGIRQPITTLFEAESSQKVRSLWACKQSAVYRANEYSGNWRVIGSGYGGEASTSAAAPRFKMAQQGDYLAFTNDFDKVKYHVLEQPAVETVLTTQDFISPGTGGGFVLIYLNHPEAIIPGVGVVINGQLWGTNDEPSVNPKLFILFTVAIPAGAIIPSGTIIYDQSNAPMQYAIPGLRDIPDLATIGLTRAACVWSWKNVVFLADVTMDNQEFAYRIVWSDLQNPLGWDPADVSSITGFADLDTRERILGGAPSVNGFLIYTTHGIWEMTVVSGDAVFNFRRAYNGEDNKGKGLLAFPNTLVSVPDVGHAYMAADGIYQFSQFMSAPQRIEYVERAAPWLYGPDQAGYEIDRTNCQVHVAGQKGDDVFFFTADEGATDQCPNRGLRLNPKYEMADVLDHGATALCNHRPHIVPTIRDFILENQICDLEGLRDEGYDYVKEGLPRAFVTPTAPFVPDAFYTTETQTVAGIEVEDWNQEEPSVHSLCALLGERTLDYYCKKCEGETLLVLADGVDWCLKQMADVVFYRERCANPTAVGTSGDDGYTSSVGSYLLNGYDSILRMAPIFTGESWVQAETLRLDFVPVYAVSPANIGLRIGIADQVADANWDTRLIVWFQHSLQALGVLTARTPAEHLALNSIPSLGLTWAFLRKGRMLHIELKIAGTGGDAVLSKVTTDVKRIDINSKHP